MQASIFHFSSSLAHSQLNQPSKEVFPMSKTPQSYPKFLHLFHVLLLLIYIFFPVVKSQPNESEHEVLLKLKQQWGIQSWGIRTNIPHCDWSGIQCSRNSITGISLQNQNITSTISAPICNIVNLTTLDLSDNFIPGGFPTVLYNCSKLQRLNLSQNYFVGPLPSDIHKLSSIQYLDISGNNFSGDIPRAIGQLAELRSLNLVNNLFDGTFPPNIGNLMNLETLEMAYNEFVPAKIPEEFGKLKKLKHLWMSNCNLIGDIPDSLANLSSLEFLDLEVNNLVGGLPSWLFQLKNITHLYLYDNELSGEISTSVEAINLLEVDLSANNLTGTIPEDFGKLHKLEVLQLFQNQLFGPIPETIGQLPLKSLKLWNNNFSGVLPPELGLHSKLEKFEVSNNQFSGKLPQYLCAGEALIGIVAFMNNFSGEVPVSLAKCNTLRMLWLEFNGLTGEIPVGLWTLPNISVLTLESNKFSGKLPFQLSEKLHYLDISNNNFSGPILPSVAANWKYLVVFMASNNQLSGAIPLELTALSDLTYLLLDDNQFSGELPSRIISWKSLVTLNTAKNKLSGPIPAALGSLPNLNCLELSNNMFSGQIPPELGRLRLSTLDLSSNNLSGKIPSLLDDVAHQYNFLNNSNLCSNTQISDLPRCSSLQHNSRSFSFIFLAMTLLPGAAIILVIFYFIFFKVTDLWQGKDIADQPVWMMTPFHNLNFSEEIIVCGLTEDNVIGSGGAGKIYCVEIDDSGGRVAIKRIWNDRKFSNALEKQFTAEAEILGRIRHSNIVKLWCCVSRADSKLLVYEYMENSSLDKWLHKKNGTQESARSDLNQYHVVLDWPTRLRIAIGAAKGLCYMHHDCSPPIIHRDVKSSNILLDSYFNAKIADFGLAKMSANIAGDPHTVSAIAGSFGYIAPEYGRTRRLNEKIDIYSFGVVLLELATGKEPCKGNEHLNLADYSWQHYCEEHPIADTLDIEIKEPCFLEVMTKVFKLGLMCTNAVPSSRPTMKRVLQLLTACSHDEASNIRAQTRDEEEHGITPFLSNISNVST